MTKLLKRMLPKRVRDVLGPCYRALAERSIFATHLPVGRDWNLQVDIPEDQRPRFLSSAVTGTLDFSVKGGFTNVLLCAQPRSASKYLTQLLALSLDFKNHQIGFDQKGGLIYYPRLLAAKFTQANTISHCHAAPVRSVVKIIRTLNLRSIVLTRNLMDALVSRRDMLVQDRWADNMLSQTAMEQFLRGSAEYQMDVVIDLFATDYINFCAGWDARRDDKSLLPIYVTYEEMTRNETGLVRDVARALNLPVDPSRVRSVSRRIREAGGINFNRGSAGRGKELLSPRQIEVLRKKAQLLGCANWQFLGFRP